MGYDRQYLFRWVCPLLAWSQAGQGCIPVSSPLSFELEAETVEVEVHDWGRIEGEHLAEDEPAADGDAQRPAEAGEGVLRLFALSN